MSLGSPGTAGHAALHDGRVYPGSRTPGYTGWVLPLPPPGIARTQPLPGLLYRSVPHAPPYARPRVSPGAASWGLAAVLDRARVGGCRAARGGHHWSQVCGGPSRGLECLAGARTPSQDQYGRDSTNNILKLEKTGECRRFSSMRPAILPISKNRLRSHDLEKARFPIWRAFSHKE